MSNKYIYIELKKPIEQCEGERIIGRVFDKETKNHLLDVTVCDYLLERHNQTMCLKSIDRNPSDFYDFCGDVRIDKSVYLKEFVNDKPYLIASLMHELGHCFDKRTALYDPNYNKIRLEYLKRGQCHPCELFADEFAIRECGINRFLYFIDKMANERLSKKESQSSKFLGMLEFKIRKEHAYGYWKKSTVEKTKP